MENTRIKIKRLQIELEAVKWQGTPNQTYTSVVEVYNFLTGDNVSGSQVKTEGEHFRFDYSGNRPELMIKTLEGELLVSRGDWIIKGVDGEYYPCKPDKFPKLYEVIS